MGEQTALVVLSHVSYRSAWLADVRRASPGSPTTRARWCCWDLCHSVGVGAGRARRLGGRPGGRLHLQVPQRRARARRRSATSPSVTSTTFTQPIQGWMGNTDPFLMGPDYVPVQGIRRFLSGTPAVVGMLAIQDMVALIDEAGHRRRPQEVRAAHRVRRRARRRAPCAVRRDGGVAARPRTPRRTRDPAPPADARGRRQRCGSAT